MKSSQAFRILSRLKQSQGEWVAMPELCRISGSLNCHSRITDLRKQGYIIDQENQRQADGAMNSVYRLVE